jgi:molybdopterin-guanine dinucleotide biosynthesis protein A
MVMPGFVLAGGASRRMGQDKARVRLNGTPLAVRTAQVLASAGCDPVHIVGKDPGLIDLGLPFVQEVETDHHPLYGVAAALDAADGPLALIAPCDLIFLDAATVTQLMAAATACVATGPSGDHPLLAVLPTDWAPKARALAQDRARAAALVQDLPRIPVAANALYDANHPSALSASP